MTDRKFIAPAVGTLAALSFSLGTFAADPEQAKCTVKDRLQRMAYEDEVPV